MSKNHLQQFLNLGNLVIRLTFTSRLYLVELTNKNDQTYHGTICWHIKGHTWKSRADNSMHTHYCDFPWDKRQVNNIAKSHWRRTIPICSSFRFMKFENTTWSSWLFCSKIQTTVNKCQMDRTLLYYNAYNKTTLPGLEISKSPSVCSSKILEWTTKFLSAWTTQTPRSKAAIMVLPHARFDGQS